MWISTRLSSVCGRARHSRLLAAVIISIIILLWWLSAKPLWAKREQEILPAYTGPRNTPVDAGENGFLSLSDARDFCQRRRWNVYSTRDQHRKLYDMFLINTELDWLEIRLNEIHEAVDFFIVLESAKSFQRNPKTLYLQEHINRKSYPTNLSYVGNSLGGGNCHVEVESAM